MKNLEKFVVEYRTKKAPTLDEVEGQKPQVDPISKNKVKWAVDEPEDNDAADGIDLNSEDNTESMEDLIDKFDTEEDFFIIGKAGWGKTSIIKKLAKKYGKKVVTVYLDKAEATDLGGIPIPTKGKSGAVQEKAMPSWAKIMEDEPDQDFLLFFDEMNQAQPDVMNALMPIVLEHEICERKFDNFFVGAAGNFESENGAVYELSGPLKSRFKPLITWDTGGAAWKSAFKYLHRKWDKVLGEKLVSKFEQYADCFDNPRELEQKAMQYAYRMKNSEGKERNNAAKYLRRLKNLAKEDITRTEEKQLEDLANSVFNYISGVEEKEGNSRRRGKDSQMVPESIKTTIESGMKEGYISVTMEDGKKIKFGVSKENIIDIIDSEECNAEMIERTIRKFENDGIKWKYEKNQNWQKIGLEDPQDDKWGLTITSKTKVEFAKPERKIKKD